MDTIERLKSAKQLLDEEVITEEEYQKLKTKLLNDLDSEHYSQTNTGTETNTPTAITRSEPVSTATSEEGATTGMKVLSFLFPIVGLILFLIDKDKKPVAARDELKWAGIGFGVGILCYIIVLAIGGCTAATYY